VHIHIYIHIYAFMCITVDNYNRKKIYSPSIFAFFDNIDLFTKNYDLFLEKCSLSCKE